METVYTIYLAIWLSVPMHSMPILVPMSDATTCMKSIEQVLAEFRPLDVKCLAKPRPSAASGKLHPLGVNPLVTPSFPKIDTCLPCIRRGFSRDWQLPMVNP